MTAPDHGTGSPTGPLNEPAAQAPAVPPPAAAPVAAGQTRKGILLMCAVSLIFAVQDALSRTLGSGYSPFLIVMLRYWFFAAFVIALMSRQPGGLRVAVRSRRPLIQILRATLLVVEIALMIFSFVRAGLVATHAIFAMCPLLVAALSGPLLGERLGWRRWSAIGVGFLGILVILQPGVRAFSPDALLALAAAFCFATYSVLTRLVARDDSSMVSFFWTCIWGAVGATAMGIWFWEPLRGWDWGWMAALCVCAAASHWLLIRAYELAEAGVLQPFAYTQLVWVSILGVVIFDERVGANVVIGVAVIVGAGLFTLWRERVRSR